MAVIVKEIYSWSAVTKEAGANEAGVKLYLWDIDESNVVNESTDALGEIDTEELENSSHSVSGSTTTTTAKTPHKIRALKYGLTLFEISKAITTDSIDTFYLTANSQIAQATKATVDAYTGIAINHTSEIITVSSNHTIAELYDWLQSEAVDVPQYDFLEVMETGDSTNYLCHYNIVCNATLTGDGCVLTIDNDNEWSGTGSFSGTIIDKNGRQISVTLTGLADGTEVRVYNGTDPATATEIDGTESTSGGSFGFSYLDSLAGVDGYIVVHALSYETIKLDITLPSNNTSIPIKQNVDRNYRNP